MRGAFLLLLWLWSAAGGAQTTYKCTDAQRRITYSNEPCDKQGLKDAGPVADRTTTMPLGPLPKPAAAATATKPPASRDEVESVQRGTQIKPIVPLLEKLSK